MSSTGNSKVNFAKTQEKKEEVLVRDLLDEQAIFNLVYTDMLINFSIARKNKLIKEGIEPNIRNTSEEIKYLNKLIRTEKTD